MKAKLILVLGLAALMAGCGGASTPTQCSTPTPTATAAATPTATASTEALGAEYLAASTTLETAYSTWSNAVTGSTAADALVAPSNAYASALARFDTTISGLATTDPVTVSDISRLLDIDELLIAELGSVGPDVATDSPSVWIELIDSMNLQANYEDQFIREDFGLAIGTGSI
ncbi:MAG: hypothetical protein ABSA40_06800 [Candidatus Dormibacteria bacterium]